MQQLPLEVDKLSLLLSSDSNTEVIELMNPSKQKIAMNNTYYW